MKEQLKEIEIPLGAKDSELCGWEYTIPDGMEATIVDNRIIVRKAESEDERIRKEIVRFIQMEVEDEIVGNKWIAWLEKQGEQKPIDKVEPFDKCEGLTDFERTLADICIGWIGEELGWKQYIKDNADVLLKIAFEKFNSMQNVLSFEPKFAWSEEDERIYQSIIDDTVQENQLDSKQIYFLKSLKERVQPQPKQEWSKEDEKLYNDLSDTYFYNDEDYPEETYKLMLKRVLDWIDRRGKSFRPQNHWKPSEEQIKQLEWIAKQNKDNMIGKELMSLYQDLKKLMWE